MQLHIISTVDRHSRGKIGRLWNADREERDWSGDQDVLRRTLQRNLRRMEATLANSGMGCSVRPLPRSMFTNRT